MIPNGLLTQIALLILSAGIIVTYIKPTFTEIGSTQNLIATYQNERGSVKEVNNTLEAKMSILTNVSATDHRRLLTYMPDEVDPIAVLRDISSICGVSGVIMNDVSDNGLIEVKGAQVRGKYSEPSTNSVDDGAPAIHAFSLNVEGSYAQIKNLFDTLEQNEYPLEVPEVNVQAKEGGFLSAEIILYTYSRLKPEDAGSDNR